MKYRQTDNEIWSVNRIEQEKYHVQNETRSLVLDLFYFLKALYEVKASGLQLSLNIFQ